MNFCLRASNSPCRSSATHLRIQAALPGHAAEEARNLVALSGRVHWSELLRRVFAVDILECPRCGGRMRLLAAIHSPDATQSILEGLNLPSRAPPTAAPLPEDAGGGVSWAVDFDAGV